MIKIITGIIILSSILLNATGISNKELNRFNDMDLPDNSRKLIPVFSYSDHNYTFNIKYFKKDYQDIRKVDNFTLQPSNTIEGTISLNNKDIVFFHEEDLSVVNQELDTIVCSGNEGLMLVSYLTFINTNMRFGRLVYKPFLYRISHNSIDNLNRSHEKLFQGYGGSDSLDSASTKVSLRYPYYNKQKVLKRLYQSELCTEPNITIKQLGNNKGDIKKITKNDIRNYLIIDPLSKKTLTVYNNIAYYLEKAKAYDEAIFLLEKILEKYPNRTVAYYNLGDAYWGLEKKEKAKEAYQVYVKQMKEKGKEKKIPKKVLERVN